LAAALTPQTQYYAATEIIVRDCGKKLWNTFEGPALNGLDG